MDIKWIEQGLKKPGKNKVGLAKALGRDPSTITKILNGTRQIKADELPIIAEYLELERSDLLPVKIVPIVTSSEPKGSDPDSASALDTIKSTLERVADLERRMAAIEDVMHAIGGLQPRKR